MLRGVNKPITLGNVKCELTDGTVLMVGKLGTLSVLRPKFLDCTMEETGLVVNIRESNLPKNRLAMTGTFIAQIKQAIIGVDTGHKRLVIFTGTGSNVKIVQDKLVMKLGKSHPIEKEIPSGIQCSIRSADIRQTKLQVFGTNEQQVGQFAAELRIRRAYSGGIHAWVEGDPNIIKKRKGAK